MPLPGQAPYMGHYIYTPPPGLGLEKKKKMAGVYHFLVYMQTASKYNTFYIHHHGGTQRPRGGVYTNCGILEQFAYTPGRGIHQAFSYFFWAQTRWWCIKNGVPNIEKLAPGVSDQDICTLKP